MNLPTTPRERYRLFIAGGVCCAVLFFGAWLFIGRLLESGARPW